ncbi:phosphonate metabolism protein PhnM [Skermania sp. ID1734]|uniref:phosphonate metabolism protein PhnM n=1 Tax=Skermania sp. ID1734 TaxID=2597516 RepID=UPI00117E7063|nr:phosphonate metabolism protein PhnM [Skermania sp. ID1734]TSD93048.1 phosphonate metabolism protein PhnM [Skermania sp. ID1734]
MSGELVLDNARLVLRDEVVLGAVTIRDGLIHDLERGRVGVGEDFDGDYLIPGAVELHTDHAEYHMRPRPDVEWEPTAAVLAHDAQMTAAGATTVLDAVRLGSGPDDDAAATARAARRLTEAIIGTRQADVLRADHLMHLRCEISAPDCLEQFESYADHPLVRLVSLMDHTPPHHKPRRTPVPDQTLPCHPFAPNTPVHCSHPSAPRPRSSHLTNSKTKTRSTTHLLH